MNSQEFKGTRNETPQALSHRHKNATKKRKHNITYGWDGMQWNAMSERGLINYVLSFNFSGVFDESYK